VLASLSLLFLTQSAVLSVRRFRQLQQPKPNKPKD
jgi:hypothetical protein